MFEDSRVLVTGGAGFIGSHVVDALMRSEASVVVLDDLSSGSRSNISKWIGNRNFRLVIGDCLRPDDVAEATKTCEAVFHLAANPEVRIGALNTKVDFEQNIQATYNILEAVRSSNTCNFFLFTSTSTVYGDATVLPTPEEYGPLRPISLYGASKLACEALISGYSYTFGLEAIVYRLANIVGPRSRHGVIIDFIEKLRRDPEKLTILGDGKQSKSYLLVDDCVDALMCGCGHRATGVEVFNIGAEDRIGVTRIAEIVTREMGLDEVKFEYTGGVLGGRGWVGDVKDMLLDISKMKGLGWAPSHISSASVEVATRRLLSEPGIAEPE